MKVKVKYMLLGIAFLAAVFGRNLKVEAEDTAGFLVQTSQVEKNCITVSVCLKGNVKLGAVDVGLVYNPEKVSYVSSKMGETFSDGYTSTNHIAEESTVKCVAAYIEGQKTKGELFQVVFRLKSGGSYQPELQVVDIIDSTIELQDIPYTISYQQYDGTWMTTPDISEKEVDKHVLKENGEMIRKASKEKKNEMGKGEKTKEGKTIQGGENTHKNKQLSAKSVGKEISGRNKKLLILIVVILAFVFVGYVLKRRRRK